MTVINWGIIGTGTIATEFAQKFSHADAKLLAVASRDAQTAKQFAKTHGIPFPYGSYQELYKDQNIDVIYIATPHNYHLEAILQALSHGKHVLCEKVITLNSHELRQAKKLAASQGLYLMEAMTLYTMPLYQHLQKRSQSGEFGPLKMIQVSFGSYKEANPNNRFFNPELAGGALYDIGTYALSFARFFLSSQPQIIASTMIPFSTGVDEQSITLLRNEQNELASIALTFQAKMPKVGILAFTEGYITIPDFPRADTAVMTYRNGQTETIQIGDSALAFSYEVTHLNQLIRGEKNIETLAITSDVLTLMDKMQGHWIP